VTDICRESDAALPPTTVQIEQPLLRALFQHFKVAAIPLLDVAATTRDGAFIIEVFQAMVVELFDGHHLPGGRLL